jgi:hypothetical protein
MAILRRGCLRLESEDFMGRSARDFASAETLKALLERSIGIHIL